MNVRLALATVFVALAVHPAAAQPLTPDTAKVAVQVSDVTLDGRLTFSGSGFAPGESTAVTIEDDQGQVQGGLRPETAESDGQVYRTAVPVPTGLAPGAHTLHLTGVTSGRFGRATSTCVGRHRAFIWMCTPLNPPKHSHSPGQDSCRTRRSTCPSAISL